MTVAAGSGLVINISYDSSVDAAPANFKNAVAAAVNFFETTFTNHITINIQVGFGEIDGTPISGAALGQSKTSAITGTYRQVYDGLADPTLPETDPTNGGSFKIANAQAKLWKLPRNSISDGSIGISSYYGASFDPNNRAVVGLYDGVAILEHEIAEVMGRTSYLGTNFFFGTSTYTALDLFRYSAPGQRVLVAAPGFFSADGIHLTNAYNDPRYGSDGGD